MKILIRYNIRKAINRHLEEATNLLIVGTHGVCPDSPTHQRFCDKRIHEMDCEVRCTLRLYKLLKRYE